MAPPSNRKSIKSHHQEKDPLKYAVNTVHSLSRRYLTISYAKSLVFDPTKLGIVSVVILVAELLLNIIVVQNVRYTEIDWVAYMQECEGFINGTTNYALLKGACACV